MSAATVSVVAKPFDHADTDDMALVRRSGLFDAGWYRERYGDPTADDADLLSHFFAHGARRGTLAEPVFRYRVVSVPESGYGSVRHQSARGLH